MNQPISKPIVERRDAPLILSMPHVGREIPDHIRSQLTGRALELEDTDWWIDQLYNFAEELGATVVRATASALCHRREPRPERRFALSRSGHHRTLPDHRLRRRIRCTGTAPRPPPRRSTGTGGPITPPTTKHWPPKSAAFAAGTRASCCTTATRSAPTCRDYSTANCRSSTSAPTAEPPVPPRWRPSSPTPAPMRSRTATAMSSTAAFAAAGSPAITATRKTASTPFRWSWRSARYLTEEAPPWSLDPAKAEQMQRRAETDAPPPQLLGHQGLIKDQHP